MIRRCKCFKQVIFAFCVFCIPVIEVKGQEIQNENNSTQPAIVIKSNLLYDITSTLSAGIEIGLNEKFTLDIPLSVNPWKFSDDRYWKHFLVQPELRYWKDHRPSGHFFGAHLHYGTYNVSRLPGFVFSDYMTSHRFDGWLAGAGVSYGYRWPLSERLSLEATLGFGYAYIDYNKFQTATDEKMSFGTYHYFGPTRAGVTLSFSLNPRRKTTSRLTPRNVAPPVKQSYSPPSVVEKRGTVEAKPEEHFVQGITTPEKELKITYVVPEAEPLKVRSRKGIAYLDFEKGSSQIDYDFGNNMAELSKIHELVESIQEDPYTQITRISLVGYASPEGVASDNILLSASRAAALKDHIKILHSIPETLFTVDGRGEDWRTIDSLVASSNDIKRYVLLEIIRGTRDADEREMLLRDGWSSFYDELRYNIYPRLRRTEYEITYRVLPFTTEEAYQQYKRNPSGLSLYEMYQVASGYSPDSAESADIFETAARLFPGSDEANLNAAASALSHKDTAKAATYLSKVKKQNDAYHNNLAVLQSLSLRY